MDNLTFVSSEHPQEIINIGSIEESSAAVMEEVRQENYALIQKNSTVHYEENIAATGDSEDMAWTFVGFHTASGGIRLNEASEGIRSSELNDGGIANEGNDCVLSEESRHNRGHSNEADACRISNERADCEQLNETNDCRIAIERRNDCVLSIEEEPANAEHLCKTHYNNTDSPFPHARRKAIRIRVTEDDNTEHCRRPASETVEQCTEVLDSSSRTNFCQCEKKSAQRQDDCCKAFPRVLYVTKSDVKRTGNHLRKVDRSMSLPAQLPSTLIENQDTEIAVICSDDVLTRELPTPSTSPYSSINKLPTYLSLSTDFIQDEPPRYEAVTGRKLRNTEYYQKPDNAGHQVTTPFEPWKKKASFLIMLFVTMIFIVTTSVIIGESISSSRRRPDNNFVATLNSTMDDRVIRRDHLLSIGRR